ncbi:MAG: SHOCT domain-containing protein [Rubrobacteraceae bacterium]
MGGVVGIIVYILFFAVLFVALRWAISGGIRDAREVMPEREEKGTGSPSAREVLDRRYAEGGLTREEYLNMRNDMTRDRDA